MYIEIPPRTFTSILSDLKMEVAKKGITTDLFAGEQLPQWSCPQGSSWYTYYSDVAKIILFHLGDGASWNTVY